jgi:hypothetical protein
MVTPSVPLWQILGLSVSRQCLWLGRQQAVTGEKWSFGSPKILAVRRTMSQFFRTANDEMFNFVDCTFANTQSRLDFASLHDQGVEPQAKQRPAK